MKLRYLLALMLSLSSSHAFAAKQCESNFKQEGSFFAGRRFSTWGDVPVSPAIAYKRIYVDALKSGLKVTSAEKEMGLISAEQSEMLNNSPVSLPWNIVIEQSGKGSKISVTKTTPPTYATSQDYQIRAMCSIIDDVTK